MSFEPDRPGPLATVTALVGANSPPLFATVDGKRFRLPRALAGGPLVVAVPAALGRPAGHGGDSSYRTVAFSRGGTVTFRAVPVGPPG